MFETLFHLKSTVVLHRSAPFAQERERFLRHCAATGAPHVSQVHRAQAMLRVAQRMVPADLGGVDAHRLREIIEQGVDRPAAATADTIVNIVRPWLKFLGWWRQPVPPIAFADELDRFVRWMRDERGLAPSTVEQWHDRTANFLRWYAQTGRNLATLKPEDIDAYFVTYGAERWCRTSAGYIGTMLRVFLRHAASRGSCATNLADSIQRPRRYHLETPPYALGWEDVGRLIATASSESEADLRDRAILMLLAVYGLRRGEVAALRVQDIDHTRQRLNIWRLKRRQPQVYPLAPSVGQALRQYIDAARPAVPYAQVFIRLTAPRRPITAGVISEMVRRRLQPLDVELAHRGPHALRHACASRMLAEGLTLKEIGDHLGHRRAESTAIYTKVDLAALRQVGEFDLGGLQ